MTGDKTLFKACERIKHPTRVFGPVRSRRLGASLGIDCLPFKTCNYDCVYCELGSTHQTTNAVTAEISPSEILDEIRDVLATIPRPDHMTIAGSGEPTLYRPLGELIAGIKALTDVPVTLLTNGSLFSRKEIRDTAAMADLVMPSLDGGNARSFAAVNRPHPDIDFEEMAEGLVRFRDEYSGTYWLEILLVEGFNTSEQDLADLKKWSDRIRPDLIHLNTVDRFPAEDYAERVSTERLKAIARYFGDRARIV